MKYEYTELNVNDFVCVKLTKLGLKHWKADFEKSVAACKGLHYPFKDHRKKYQSKGWTYFQLHQLMDIFGSSMAAGLPNMFETTMRIPKGDWVGV